MPKLFPTPEHPNVAIVTSIVKGKDSSSLAVNALPDLHIVGDAQCFSLYTYDPVPEGELPIVAGSGDVVEGYVRKDNITDGTLLAYRGIYKDILITKEDIFYYVYGLLHSPAYKDTYKADLMKMLPRIPKVREFWGFSRSGRALADLHLNYETVEPFPLEELVRGEPAGDEYDFYRVSKISFGARKDRSHVVYNSCITLAGIPDEAYQYQINGKSALEWVIDRYQVTTHKDSLITNDPNDYCREVANPRYILDLIKRIVRVSVESNQIVLDLPVFEVLE